VLVTVTSRLRIHRDEVLCARVKGNSIVLSFVSMKPIRIPIDDLTEEARAWLLPSLAPREIPVADLLSDDEEDEMEAAELDRDEVEADETH
jgi:hypothetical protein